ncbi:Uncharacterised protein [Citrobacter freundii]|nr:Uncharacterised protein [Citrobacter freundii]
MDVPAGRKESSATLMLNVPLHDFSRSSTAWADKIRARPEQRFRVRGPQIDKIIVQPPTDDSVQTVYKLL